MGSEEVGGFVGKHRAPKGALRLLTDATCVVFLFLRQKAPSAKRCIKTLQWCACDAWIWLVRKHRAPKGALRQGVCVDVCEECFESVRKHRAPKDALRQ